MTMVWRLEWEHGPGPYSSPDVVIAPTAMDRAGFDNAETEHRPAPWHDFKRPPHHPKGGIWDENMRYGFASRRELVRWFDRETRKMLRMVRFGDYKMCVVTYEAQYVVYGGRQVAFDMSTATKKGWRYL